MRKYALMLVTAAAFCSAALAQIKIDGRWDVMYGDPIAVQDSFTAFGDSHLGRPDIAGGSELDGGYGFIYNGYLYLFLAGNLESNGNDLEIFIDSRAGGQNQLRYENPGVDTGDRVRRMSDLDPNVTDPNTDGLRFTPGFGADFWVSMDLLGDPGALRVQYAELYVDAGNPGAVYYCGTADATCGNADGTLSGGDAGAPAILANIDDRNVLGVPGTDGVGGGDPAEVKTGMELAIPLSAIGNPTGSVDVTVFVNGQQHDFISNQFLWGLFGSTANLGEPRAADLSLTAHFPMTIPVLAAPVGACCTGTTCSIKTQAQCGGTWLGPNTSCDSNPCDGVPGGRCCVDDGYSGACSITTQAECAGLGGNWTGGATCDGCPCLLLPTGACCVGNTCSVTREAECLLQSGSYLGNYTNCNNTPCASGACCTGTSCAVVRQFECASGSTYLGDDTTCNDNPCAGATIPDPHIAGPFQGWDPTSTPMTPAGTNKWTYLITGLPAGGYIEYKITTGLGWDGGWPTNGNCYGYANANGELLATYDGNYYNDGWKPARDRLPVPTDQPGGWIAVGNYLSEIGGSDWNNADTHGTLTQQPDGSWYKEVTGLPAGTYDFKFVDPGFWRGMNFNWRGTDTTTQNCQATINATTDTLKLYLDEHKGAIRWEVVAAGPSPCPGDLNCDGTIDFADIDPFVLSLSGEQAYLAQFPNCRWLNGDANGDNTVDFADIDAFVGLLFTACP